jgi:ABC-type dipeptide/oligopeptide/nickel transport system permease component
MSRSATHPVHLPVLFGIVVVVFFVVALIPGDAVAAMMTQIKLNPEQMANLRRQLGLDDPLHVQLGRYLADLFQGDLGDRCSATGRSAR